MNDTSTARQAIEQLAARVATDRGLALVEVALTGNPGSQHVRIFLDKVGGIGILDLKGASEEISAVLDAENPIAGRFTLEVSSPGLDRPLRTADDFARARGRLVHLDLSAPVVGRADCEGTLIEAGPDSVTLDLDGAPTRVPLASIQRARMEVALGRATRRTNDKRSRRAHG